MKTKKKKKFLLKRISTKVTRGFMSYKFRNNSTLELKKLKEFLEFEISRREKLGI